MALSDLAVRSVKPGQKAARLFDGGGFYLEVTPAGGKLWRLKYRFGGKEKVLALGKYPEVSLRDARERRDEARKQLANEIAPGVHRKSVKADVARMAASSSRGRWACRPRARRTGRGSRTVPRPSPIADCRATWR
jgi:hypothetical protein